MFEKIKTGLVRVYSKYREESGMESLERPHWEAKGEVSIVEPVRESNNGGNEGIKDSTP